MRLVMTLLVRDEADIVADTLDYHLARGVDHVIATDNGSVDGTRSILERYRDAGVLTLLDEPGRDYAQPAWVTRMARLAATDLGADWVVHADADEFFWLETGASLRDALAAVPESFSVLVVPVVHFRPRPEAASSDGPFFERLQVRDTLSFKPRSTVTRVTHVLHRAHPAAVVGPANRVVDAPRFRVLEGWEPITCLHFPMRSWAQYRDKVVRGDRPFKPWSHDEHVVGEGLRAFFDAHVVDDEAVREGIRAGTLTFDDRLGRFMGALREGKEPSISGPPAGGGALAWPELDPEVAERRAAAMRDHHLRLQGPGAEEYLRVRRVLRRIDRRRDALRRRLLRLRGIAGRR